jgi:hypothetical protein
MTFNTFKERLDIIRNLDIKTDDAVEKFNSNNPFITDAGGVRSDLLADLLWEHLFTLFSAVKEAPYNKIKDFVDYYLYDQNYGGEVTYLDQVFHLDDDKELYDYLVEALV